MAVTTRFGGDASDWLAEQEKVVRGSQEIQKETAKIAKESRDAARIAEQALRRSENASEKYERQIKAVRTALQQGKITLADYNRAVDQLATEYNEASNAGESAFQRISNSVILAIDPVNLLREGVQVLTAAYREARQEAERLALQSEDAAISLAKLKQISDDQADFRRLLEETTRLQASGAVRDEREAAQVRFAIRSAGLDEDLATFQALGRSGLDENLLDIITAVRAITAGLGREEVGNTAQILSKGLVASTKAQTELAELLTAASSVGGITRRVGIGDEQVLAAIAATADVRGPSVAAAEFRSLLTALDKAAIKGDDIRELIAEVDKRTAATGNIRDVLGDRQEALAAFDALKLNADLLSNLIAEVSQANDAAALAQKQGFTDQRVDAAFARREAQGSRDVALQAVGTRETLQETLKAQLDELNQLAGQGSVQRAINRSRFDVFQLLGFDNPNVLATTGGAAEQVRLLAQQQGTTAEVLPRLEIILESIADTNRRLAEVNTRPRPAVPEPEAAN